MPLDQLKPAPGSTHSKKRLGRGSSSGHGGSAGRGEKGYLSRSGSVRKRGFEGGQKPIHLRLPKRGFKNIWAEEVQVLNVRDLARLPEGSVVEPESLKKAGLIRKVGTPVKILGEGTVERAFEVRACKLSAAAEKKITEAGGKVVAS
ncbi:50S ribosomal protein L15 [bacterium]|nr:50S ribosomal protein L15 [bacterium]MBU1985471.1 50S ribosomal protein L15 [bacterium]